MFDAGRASVNIYSGMVIKAYATNLHGNVSVTPDGGKIDVSTDASSLFPEKEKV